MTEGANYMGGEETNAPFQRVSGASYRRVLRRSEIEKRLRQAGIKSNALTKFIYMEANNFAGLQDPEDILQEAIIRHLNGGEDIKKHIWRFAKVGHKEMSIENFAVKTEDQEWFYSVLEQRESDNERGDWIPNDPILRTRLADACRTQLAKPPRPKKASRHGAKSTKFLYYGWISLLGKRQVLGYYDTEAECLSAEREAIERILRWVSED